MIYKVACTKLLNITMPKPIAPGINMNALIIDFVFILLFLKLLI